MRSLAAALLVGVALAHSHYEELGVSRTATKAEIKRAYRAKALETHPDKCKGSNECFLTVKMAYDTLISDTLRSKYDASLDASDAGKKQGASGRTRPKAPLKKSWLGGWLRQMLHKDKSTRAKSAPESGGSWSMDSLVSALLIGVMLAAVGYTWQHYSTERAIAARHDDVSSPAVENPYTNANRNRQAKRNNVSPARPAQRPPAPAAAATAKAGAAAAAKSAKSAAAARPRRAPASPARRER